MLLLLLMSYRKYTNLGKKFNSDLTRKVMEDIFDENLGDRKRNCSAKSLMVGGSCMYDGEHYKSMVVYGLLCKYCNKSYVGKNQLHSNQNS